MAFLGTLALLLPTLVPGARMSAAPASTAPVIDGRLSDQVWQVAPVSSDFVQRFPDDGMAPSETTTVRVLYDDRAVYIGVDCRQIGTPLLRRLTRRDRETSGDKLNRREGSLDSDQVALTIGSRRDRSSAFRFAVNAAGVLSDGLYYDDTAFDRSWDENWEARVATTELGWSAEFRIPFRVLRFEAAPVQEWGFNVQRTIAMRQELDEWADIPRTVGGYVSRLGRLEGLVGLEPPRADLEVRPFVVGKIGRQDARFGPLLGANGLTSFSHSLSDPADRHLIGVGAAVGADARWHVTRDLTLDATVNPDFGQVEADQVVLNLTTVETLYPEKRPFFLEGLDVFATPLRVLYTRRIGSVPSMPELPAGETATEGVSPSAIPAALKLVGRLTPTISVGLLSSAIAANQVAVATPAGDERERIADPTTMLNVLRLKQAFSGGAYVGVIGSATNRFESPGLYPAATDGSGVACPGRTTPRAGQSCFHDAYVGGVDARWRDPSGDYAVSGQALVSRLRGGQPIALRDGTILGPGATGSGATVNVAKEGGRHWLWELDGSLLSRHLRLDDAGYLPRQNLVAGSFDLTYRTKEPWWITLETASKIELRKRRNLDGLQLADDYQLNSTVLLRNYWTLFGEIHYRAAHFDDRETGDGTALARAGLVGWEWGVTGDPRRAVAGQMGGLLQKLTNGVYAEVDGGVVVHALPQLDVELLPQLSYADGEPRFVGDDGAGQLRFGRLHAAGVGGTVRMTWTFTPRLTLQTYAQLFLARGHYDDFSSYARAPGSTPTVHLGDLAYGAAPPTASPDFQRAALNASIVLRWEYQLGSLLYVVYTRSQTPVAPLDPGEKPRLDLGSLRNAPAASVLLFKLTHFWG